MIQILSFVSQQGNLLIVYKELLMDAHVSAIYTDFLTVMEQINPNIYSLFDYGYK